MLGFIIFSYVYVIVFEFFVLKIKERFCVYEYLHDCMCITCSGACTGLKENERFPGSGVTDSCEPSRGLWQPNSGLLQE